MAQTLSDANKDVMKWPDTDANTKSDRVQSGQEGGGHLHTEDTKMTLICRLMLSAELTGAEAGMAFEQLYTVPNLQTLGMPLSLVSLTGLVAGLTSTLFLPLMGCYSDRGANPVRRRTGLLILSAFILVSGMIMVIAANLLHLKSYLSVPRLESSNHTLNRTMSTANPAELLANQSGFFANNITAHTETFLLSTASIPQLTATCLSPQTSQSLSGVSDESWSSNSPFTTGMGMLGYVLADVGYECVTSNVKTWMVACSPPSAPTPTLVAGLVMTSLGGVLSAGLGMIDLANAFGLSSNSQVELTVQICIQATVVIVVAFTGMVSSIIVGIRQYRRLYHNQLQTHHKSDIQTTHRRSVQPNHLIEDDAEDLFSKSGVPSEDDPVLLASSDENPQHSAIRRCRTSTFMAGHQEETSEESVMDYGTMANQVQHAAVQDGLDFGSNCSELMSNHSSSTEKLLTDDGNRADPGCNPCGRRFSFRMTMVILCGSTYFTMGVSSMFILTSSDFVGKAIFSGDPEASPESDSLARYQAGLRAASYGFLFCYCVYLIFSFLQQRVLASIGYTLEYVIIHLMLSACMVVTALTARMETFFVLCAFAGIHRACFHVVPFAVVSELVHAEGEKAADGKGSKLGTAMSMVTASMNLAYCTLFPWVGPLMDVTGIVSMSLWLAAIFGCVSAALFQLLKVKQ